MTERFDFKGGKIVKADTGKSRFIVYSAPGKAEREDIEVRFGIDSRNIDSALDPDELGRLEKHPKYWAFLLKTPCNFTSEDQLLFTVTSMGLFLSRDQLIVVTPDPFDLSDYKTPHEVKTPKDAFLAILYGTATHFLAHIKVITMLSDSLEKRINTSMENHFLLNMFTLEKSLVFFVNGIGSNQVVIEKIKENSSKIVFTAGQEAILDEIIIENRQCDKQAEIYSNILTGLMDARGSVVNNNLNILIKRLTIMNVVFMPLNLLAGMGGMSEFSGWTAGFPWWVAYPAALTVFVGIGYTLYKILEKSTYTGFSGKDASR